tara:strand:- start:256 stop:780 length:525 start_codon:yes stop_codon:yes gene_type:complete
MRALFLDRDGVINRSFIKNGKPKAPLNIKDLIFLPNVKDKLIKIKKKNFLIIVISNQPDIQKGLISIKTIESMNKKILSSLPIDEIYICPHSKDFGCDCRKPRNKFFKKAINKYDINPLKSFMVGDRKSDIDSVLSLKIPSIFIDRNYSEPKPFSQISTFRSSSKALNYILENL